MNRRARRTASVSLAVTALVTGLAGTTVPASAAGDEPNRVVGSARGDRLVGTNGADMVVGRARGDMMYGKRNVDLLIGGAGLDTMYGGSGSDLTLGGPESDAANSGTGSDVVIDNAGNDTQRSGRGHDWLVVGRGDDALWAGPGSDLLLVLNDRRDDSISCGAGNDVVVAIRGRDRLDDYSACEQILRPADLLDALMDRQVPPPRVLFGAGSDTAMRAQSTVVPSTDPLKLARHYLR
jgi:Ca2+-binding RTX toxin-like protein